MAIDYERARLAFEKYLDGYDREVEKIKLKIVHTYGVVTCAGEIAKRMNLSSQEVELARLIGLLHDIGRFEQIRLYDSFQPTTMDHAAYGAELLFGEKKMIRNFLEDAQYDEIIEQAIAKHSDFQLRGITDSHTLLHAKLIRDADKLDNCRVKLEESIQVLLGVGEEEVGKTFISPPVWEACQGQKSVLSSLRVTKMDYWISYLAQYYELYFPETYGIMVEQDYISKMIKRLPYENPDTDQKMRLLEADLNAYANAQKMIHK